jgi:hypothetical protein
VPPTLHLLAMPADLKKHWQFHMQSHRQQDFHYLDHLLTACDSRHTQCWRHHPLTLNRNHHCSEAERADMIVDTINDTTVV